MTAEEREQRAVIGSALRAEMRSNDVGFEYTEDDVIADISSHSSDRPSLIKKIEQWKLPVGQA